MSNPPFIQNHKNNNGRISNTSHITKSQYAWLCCLAEKAHPAVCKSIRAGMALLLAALCAQGESLIRNIGQIERGYERVDEKLRALGADIVRAPA